MQNVRLERPDLEFDLYCEWGRHAVERYSGLFEVTVIVDVLSFSTCVDISVSLGAAVFPWPQTKLGADALAERIGGRAVGLRGTESLSLSPASMTTLKRGERAVLPSPNGAALTLLSRSPTTIAACLRNAKAVADWISRRGARVLIVPSGEAWPDGRLRPALEDWLGAGAIVSGLADRVICPEAGAAATAFRAASVDMRGSLLRCYSGRELVMRGYSADVDLAAELNVSCEVPILDQLSAPGFEAAPYYRSYAGSG